LTANGKRFTSQKRHSLALLSLAGGSLWFLISLSINFYDAVNDQASAVLFSDKAPLYSYPVLNSIQAGFEPALPYLSICYLLITVLLFIRLYGQYRKTRLLFSDNIKKADPEVRVFLQQLVLRMGIKKNVSIWVSKMVDTPLTLGFWRPIILLPIAAINQLSIKQTEAIILHELHHIQRNDYLINLLIACTDIVLFFNPFSRIFSEIIKKERENCCDDLVLQFKYDPATYAQALLQLEQNRTLLNPIAIAATGKNKQLLLNRVKRILTKETVSTPVNQKLIASFICAVLIGMIGWYNPGKVIVNTVKSVNENALLIPTVAETDLLFSTPKEEAKDAGVLTVNLKLSKKPDNRKNQKNNSQLPIVNIKEIQKLTITPESLEPLLSFVGAEETRAYSIPETKIAVPETKYYEEYPYVPSSSFSYQFMEDTAMPKKYMMTPGELKAKESLENALKALEELNWQKLAKEINTSGKKVDIVKLQNELKKALSDVDWKKINEETQALTLSAEEILKDQQVLRGQLQTFQKDRIVRQEKAKKAQDIILMDRLQQTTDEVKKKATLPAASSSNTKKKKIIII